MIEAIGSKVLKLVRTGIGPIEISGLKIGHVAASFEDREIEMLSGARRSRRS